MRLTPALLLCACRIGFDPLAQSGDGGGGDALDAAPPPLHVEGPGTWSAVPAAPIPARIWTSAVWTGKEFIVHGGATDASYTPTNTGARFDPVAGTWSATSTVNISRSHTPHLVWTGSRMITYGGGWGLGPVATGGSYDPGTDTWTPISASPPGLRIYGTAVAIGSRMLIWGGWANTPGHYLSGYIYDPDTAAWTAMSTAGAPTARSFTGAVWTGSKVLVWGGCDGSMGSCPGVKGDGAIYDPALDQWTPMSNTGAPSARSHHSAVWTGTEMVVFGGATTANIGGKVNTGAAYNVATDSWRPISTVGAPSARAAPAAAWLGDKMVLFGSESYANDGFLYDPVTDQWTTMAIMGAPTSRARFAYAVSGDALFVWGGSYSAGTGAVWRP